MPRDGPNVVGDVLAGAAVAAGQRAHQPALLVEQVDASPSIFSSHR